jgi:hypothetical protein
LIPERTADGVSSDGYDATMREALVPEGAEFISAWRALCDAGGCLTRIGPDGGDLVSSDQVHLTEKGSVFLVRSIIGPLLGGPASANPSR